MGRFYQTAKPTFVRDNVYTPPFELISKVIANADSQIQENENALISLNDKLQAQGLAVDEPRLKEIINGYHSKIDELTAKLQKNPLEFRRETGNIRGLGREVADNWLHGEVAAIQGNKVARDKFVKEYTDRVKDKEGRVLQQDVDNATALFDKMYNSMGGAKYDNGRYNSYYTENLNPFVDMSKIADEVGKGWEADKKSQGFSNVGGKWIKEGVNGVEVADTEEIRKAITDRLMNDNELGNYYNQQMKLGFISPEQFAAKLENASNIYAEKYGYKRTNSTSHTEVNPYTKQAIDFQNDIAKQNNEHKLRMAEKQAEWEHENKKELSTVVKEVNGWVAEKADYLKQKYNQDLSTMGNKLGLSGNITEKDIINKLNYLKQKKGLSDAAYNTQMNELKESKRLFQKGSWEASYTSLSDIFGTKSAVAAQKAMNNYVKDPRNMYNVPLRIDLGNGYVMKGTVNDLRNKTLSNGKKVFNFENDNGDPIKILGTDSALPVIYDENNFGKNDMQFQMELGDGRIVNAYASFNDLGLDKR